MCYFLVSGCGAPEGLELGGWGWGCDFMPVFGGGVRVGGDDVMQCALSHCI